MCLCVCVCVRISRCVCVCVYLCVCIYMMMREIDSFLNKKVYFPLDLNLSLILNYNII